MGKEHIAVERIKERLGEKVIIETREFRNETTLVVAADAILDVARLLKEEPILDYSFLSDICGVDWPNRSERFEVVYNIYSIRHNSRLRLKVRVKENEPSLPSVTPIWPTANWHEREAFDMFGIEFVGHPDPRRILNPDDFAGFPYRKDFPIR
jgi:NADH-quinone oxidoreductase subunit C